MLLHHLWYLHGSGVRSSSNLLMLCMMVMDCVCTFNLCGHGSVPVQCVPAFDEVWVLPACAVYLSTFSGLSPHFIHWGFSLHLLRLACACWLLHSLGSFLQS
jgi:hypothetical protein